MSSEDQVTSTAPSVETPQAEVESKGKGKAPATEEPASAINDEDDEESEEDQEEPQEAEEDADEDGMEEIDTENIISDGRRTRGKAIDFAKAAQELDEEDAEDEEDDEDFEDPDEEMQD